VEGPSPYRGPASFPIISTPSACRSTAALPSLRKPQCGPTAPSPSQASARAPLPHCPRSCRHPLNRSSAFFGRREVAADRRMSWHGVQRGLRERLGRHLVGPDQVAEVRSGEHRVRPVRGLPGAAPGAAGRGEVGVAVGVQRAGVPAGASARPAPVPTPNDGEDGSARAASATSRRRATRSTSPCPVLGSVHPAASPTSTAPGASGRSVQASFIGYDTHGPAGRARSRASANAPVKSRWWRAASTGQSQFVTVRSGDRLAVRRCRCLHRSAFHRELVGRRSWGR
jgi:hypothetical protein